MSQIVTNPERAAQPDADALPAQPETEMTETTYHIPWHAGLFDKVFMAFVYLFIVVFALLCLIPFWLVISASFTPEASLRLEGFQLIPPELTLSAYRFVLEGEQVFRSYSITIIVTVVGTVLGMGITTPFAYVLASKKAKYANFLAFMTYFTMIFGGGLIGIYILVTRWLGLKDNLWAMILPYLMNPFYAFILVAYFRSLPQEILDAATIDGANDIVIFFRIAVPLAKPAIASVALFYALRYWNDWWLPLLFIDDPNMHSLQMMIRKVFSEVNAANYIGSENMIIQEALPTYGVRMVTAILTTGPIILLYPFIQRYFVKGITLGAVKG